jgi:hypothetical protein
MRYVPLNRPETSSISSKTVWINAEAVRCVAPAGYGRQGSTVYFSETHYEVVAESPEEVVKLFNGASEERPGSSEIPYSHKGSSSDT